LSKFSDLPRNSFIFFVQGSPVIVYCSSFTAARLFRQKIFIHPMGRTSFSLFLQTRRDFGAGSPGRLNPQASRIFCRNSTGSFRFTVAESNPDAKTSRRNSPSLLGTPLLEKVHLFSRLISSNDGFSQKIC
jgi:hypothetical protein